MKEYCSNIKWKEISFSCKMGQRVTIVDLMQYVQMKSMSSESTFYSVRLWFNKLQFFFWQQFFFFFFTDLQCKDFAEVRNNIEKKRQNQLVYIVTLPPEAIAMWMFLLSWKTFCCSGGCGKEILIIMIHLRVAYVPHHWKCGIQNYFLPMFHKSGIPV